MPPPQETFRVLKSSLTAPETARIDIQFWVFTRRSRITEPGLTVTRIDSPCPIFGMSSILTKYTYFNTLLSSGFNESIADATYTSPFPHNEAFVEDYDYESDSDLDEEEHEDGEKESDGKSATTLDVQKRDNTSKCEDITVEGPLFSSNGGVSIDTDIVSMAMAPYTSTCRQVIIKDTAFITWYALIYFLYSGEIAFHALKSKGKTERKTATRQFLANLHRNFEPPCCSPKSMYRLADKLGLEDLKTKALDAIQTDLTASNIFTEVLSRYTSLYPKVMDEQITYLCAHFREQFVIDGWEEAVKRICRGDCPHAEQVVTILLQKRLEPIRADNAVPPKPVSYYGGYGRRR